MSQRVNIQYSVKIGDLEQEVQRLVTKAFSLLEAGSYAEADRVATTLSVESHEQIDQLRLTLSDVDTILADVNMIIGSYLSYKSQEMMQSVARPSNPLESQGETIPELSELQEKISNFKNKLADVGSEIGGENDADLR
jgi:hypothetical protein|tara:strand:+ start:266 stop:679 length:414 start_codon:yes stop_codon:yes gene_type:complete